METIDATTGPAEPAGTTSSTRTTVVRYRTRPEAAGENQRLVEEVIAELTATAPDGLRYAAFRLADGVTFVHVAITEGEANPLTATPAFAAFQRGLGDRLAEGPEPSAASVVGAYRLLG